MAPPFRNTIVVLGARDHKGPDVTYLCSALRRRGWTPRTPDAGSRAPGALAPGIAVVVVRGTRPAAPG